MKLKLSRRADMDIDRLYDFLIKNKASRETAAKAILTIKNSLLSLCDNPKLGTSLDDAIGRRVWRTSFGKHEYITYYIPDYDNNKINILRIWHSSEDR